MEEEEEEDEERWREAEGLVASRRIPNEQETIDESRFSQSSERMAPQKHVSLAPPHAPHTPPSS